MDSAGHHPTMITLCHSVHWCWACRLAPLVYAGRATAWSVEGRAGVTTDAWLVSASGPIAYLLFPSFFSFFCSGASSKSCQSCGDESLKGKVQLVLDPTVDGFDWIFPHHLDPKWYPIHYTAGLQDMAWFLLSVSGRSTTPLVRHILTGHSSTLLV